MSQFEGHRAVAWEKTYVGAYEKQYEAVYEGVFNSQYVSTYSHQYEGSYAGLTVTASTETISTIYLWVRTA